MNETVNQEQNVTVDEQQEARTFTQAELKDVYKRQEQKKAEERKNLEICKEEQNQPEQPEEAIPRTGEERGVEIMKKLIELLGIPDPNWVE